MNRFDVPALLREVDHHRNEVVELDGEPVPKSAAILMSCLPAAENSMVRFQIYLKAIGECRLAGKTAAAVKLAHAQYQEFQDIASLRVYSEALTENGEIEAGVTPGSDYPVFETRFGRDMKRHCKRDDGRVRSYLDVRLRDDRPRPQPATKAAPASGMDDYVP